MSQFIEERPTQPAAFIQWKGTDVCMDFHCDCGKHNHYDAEFAYNIRCGGCGQVWEMPCFVLPRKIEFTVGVRPIEPIGDHDDD